METLHMEEQKTKLLRADFTTLDPDNITVLDLDDNHLSVDHAREPSAYAQAPQLSEAWRKVDEETAEEIAQKLATNAKLYVNTKVSLIFAACVVISGVLAFHAFTSEVTGGQINTPDSYKEGSAVIGGIVSMGIRFRDNVEAIEKATSDTREALADFFATFSPKDQVRLVEALLKGCANDKAAVEVLREFIQTDKEDYIHRDTDAHLAAFIANSKTSKTRPLDIHSTDLIFLLESVIGIKAGQNPGLRGGVSSGDDREAAVVMERQSNRDHFNQLLEKHRSVASMISNHNDAENNLKSMFKEFTSMASCRAWGVSSSGAGRDIAGAFRTFSDTCCGKPQRTGDGMDTGALPLNTMAGAQSGLNTCQL